MSRKTERKHIWVVEEFKDGKWEPVQDYLSEIQALAFHARYRAQEVSSECDDKRTRVRRYVREE